MKLNIVLNGKTKERCLADLNEAYADSNVTLLTDFNKIIEVEITDKQPFECVFPLEGLKELEQYYGYEVRIY